MYGTRDAPSPFGDARAAGAGVRETAPAAARHQATPPTGLIDIRTGAGGGFFEDLTVGAATPLGDHLFVAEDVIRFATTYDPQPFHVDPEAARRSHFGGLCASGWHTGAACMRKLVDRRAAARAALEAKGARAPAMGSSPGFKNLGWHKPVYAGDTISYTTTVVDKRESASRPNWGLVFSRNTGVNQRGELVFEFTGAVFIERRGA